MIQKYTAPKYKEKAFNCPRCNAFSHQDWYSMEIRKSLTQLVTFNNFDIAICANCEKISIWRSDSKQKSLMVYPLIAKAPLPDQHMPEHIKIDYNEARSIAALSPESALMLLRRCLEKICVDKKATGNNLFEKIDDIIKKENLDDQIKKALDVVRLVGNYVAHTTDRRHNEDETIAVFETMNYISNRIYDASQAKIDEIYDTMLNNKKINKK